MNLCHVDEDGFFYMTFGDFVRAGVLGASIGLVVGFVFGLFVWVVL